MGRLQRYVLLNVFKAFVPAFVALVLLMAVGMCLQLLHDGLDVVRLASLLRLVFAYSVPMVLPSAFLTAIILTFGRLAADNELIAVRAAGIHMFRAVHPVLWAACLLALVAAYFQFETVPRSQGAMRALKAKALKQILLEKAALSWSRRFSFPPVHIMYGDFRNGRMHDVLVVQTDGRKPSTITTARTAVIEPDPDPARIVFRMSDRVRTYFELQEGQPPQRLDTTEISYNIRAVSTPESVMSRRRYMVLGDLMAEVKRLSAAVAEHPRLEDPESMRKKLRGELQRLQAQMHRETLKAKKKDYDKKTIHIPREQSKARDRADADIADARHTLDELQPQLDECKKALDDAQDFERRVELGTRQEEILGKMAACDEKIRDARARRETALRELADAESDAKRLDAEIKVLEEDNSRLAGQQREIRKRLRIAEDQEDLVEIRIRIHKRLSQALSVFTFALLGIPLGIAGGRGNVMISFGLSFAIVLMVFYPLLILGQTAAEAGTLPLVPAIWGGNILTLAIGAILSIRVFSR